METGRRLLSLDVLRGFDMMLIMGVGTLIVAICSLSPGGSECWLAQNMHHVAWDGLHIEDCIFPTFLFIAGISFPFSYAKQISSGSGKGRIVFRVVRRAAVLVLLGLVYNGLFKLDFENLRCASVLARIGLAWMFAALFYMFCPLAARIGIAGGILVGYWLLMWLVPAPDVSGAEPFSHDGNLAGYIDRLLLPGRMYEVNFDPEGLLSTLPAIVTAMLGMFTGEFVRGGKITGKGKTLRMIAAAAVLIVSGLIWSYFFPINKKLWSSSFVLVVGGASLALFAIFYYIIDVRGWQKWTLFFKVIGMNSITIYMAQKIIDFGSINRFFLGGLAGLCPEPVGAVILSAGYVAVCWLFLYFLYRQKIFLKV